jgi:hypothetical protein
VIGILIEMVPWPQDHRRTPTCKPKCLVTLSDTSGGVCWSLGSMYCTVVSRHEACSSSNKLKIVHIERYTEHRIAPKHNRSP